MLFTSNSVLLPEKVIVKDFADYQVYILHFILWNLVLIPPKNTGFIPDRYHSKIKQQEGDDISPKNNTYMKKGIHQIGNVTLFVLNLLFCQPCIEPLLLLLAVPNEYVWLEIQS